MVFAFVFGVFQSFAIFVYWLNGPSAITVWTPSIIAAIAASLIYILFNEIVQSRTEIESNKIASRLAMQVAHDIRAPIGALKILINQKDTLPNNIANVAMNAVHRIESIAHDVLVSSNSRDKAGLAVDMVQISEYLDLLIQEKRSQYREKISINLIFDNGTYLTKAKLELRKLQRVISNMIDNAADSSGRKVDVRIRVYAEDKLINITVEDDGGGIPIEQLEKIKSGIIQTTKPNGNGLGLRYAFDCVESWFGTIEIDSTVGLGTKITIKLPIL